MLGVAFDARGDLRGSRPRPAGDAAAIDAVGVFPRHVDDLGQQAVAAA